MSWMKTCILVVWKSEYFHSQKCPWFMLISPCALTVQVEKKPFLCSICVKKYVVLFLNVIFVIPCEYISLLLVLVLFVLQSSVCVKGCSSTSKSSSECVPIVSQWSHNLYTSMAQLWPELVGKTPSYDEQVNHWKFADISRGKAFMFAQAYHPLFMCIYLIFVSFLCACVCVFELEQFYVCELPVVSNRL